MVQVLFGLVHYINIERNIRTRPLSRTLMALIFGIFIIVIILALLAGAAQAWGVDSREDSLDSHASQRALR